LFRLLGCQALRLAAAGRAFSHVISAAIVSHKIDLNDFNNPIVQAVVFGATASLPPIARSHPVDAFAALQFQIHDDLRSQHPEWIEANGESPMCDFYEARLAQLLDDYVRTKSDESVAAVHRAIQEVATVDCEYSSLRP
jgi:hypothetical protein